MPKNLKKTIARDPERADLVKKTARICGVSTNLVYKVLTGDRNNEEVFSTYMFLLEGGNALVEEAKKLVPFN